MEEKSFSEFKEKIYKYCDNNIGNKILFLGFESIYTSHDKITPKDLVNLTEIIIHDLIEKNILREVEKKEYESVYALYEILPHEKLIKDNLKRK